MAARYGEAKGTECDSEGTLELVFKVNKRERMFET